MVNPWEEGLGRKNHVLLTFGGGRGTRLQLQKVEKDSGNTMGDSQPLPGTLLRSRLAVVAQRSLEKARTAGRGGSAGRGWPRKGRSLQREPAGGLKVSPSQVLCNGSHPHQPLLLRPISMLNCSLWPRGQHYRGVRTHQCGESGQGFTGTHPRPALGGRLRPRGSGDENP